jgi:hypothetical protein
MSMENHLAAKDSMFVNEAYKYSEKVQGFCQHELIRLNQGDNLECEIQHIERYSMHFVLDHRMPINKINNII